MPLIEKPNRAEILAEKDRKERERKLNTRRWSGMDVERLENDEVMFDCNWDYDISNAYLQPNEVAELIEFIQEGYQKVLDEPRKEEE